MVSAKDSKQVANTASAANTSLTNSATQINSIKATIDSWKKCWTDCQQQWAPVRQQYLDQIQKARKQFNNYFCYPLGKFYRALPADVTCMKFNLIGQYSQKSRLLFLEGFTLLVAISSLRFRPKEAIGFTRRVLSASRNSAVTFLLGGLLVAPQIYNPIIKSDF